MLHHPVITHFTTNSNVQIVNVNEILKLEISHGRTVNMKNIWTMQVCCCNHRQQSYKVTNANTHITSVGVALHCVRRCVSVRWARCDWAEATGAPTSGRWLQACVCHASRPALSPLSLNPLVWGARHALKLRSNAPPPGTSCSFTVHRDCWQPPRCGGEVKELEGRSVSVCIHVVGEIEVYADFQHASLSPSCLLINTDAAKLWAGDCSRVNLNCLVVVVGLFELPAARADIHQVLSKEFVRQISTGY